jgi:hypothetical protein
MPVKKHEPDHIVTLLRQVEVELASGKTTPQVCKKLRSPHIPREIFVRTLVRSSSRRNCGLCSVFVLEFRR